MIKGIDNVNQIRESSAAALPDRPAERGYKTEQVKESFYKPSELIVGHINRIVGEVNSELSAEATVRTNAASGIRNDITSGALVAAKADKANNAQSAINAENANVVTGSIASNVEAVTQSLEDNSNRVATTSYVRQAISDALNITESTIQLTNPPIESERIVQNELKKQGNFVIGWLTYTSENLIGIGSSIGFVPEGFRPKEIQKVKGDVMGALVLLPIGNISVNLGGTFTIKSNGEVVFSSVVKPSEWQLWAAGISIGFGYRIN